MGKEAPKYCDVNKIKRMAKEYGVDKNPLFQQTLKNYFTVQRTIEVIDGIVNSEEEIIVVKEYVKGRENVYTHPAVKELPKLIDAANKTLDKLLDIIKELGNMVKETDPLLDFIDDGK